MSGATGAVTFAALRGVPLATIEEMLRHGAPWLKPQSTDVWLLREMFGQTSFIAMDAELGIPAGIVVAALEHDRTPRALYIDQIAVVAQCRHRGAARSLLQHCEHVALARGAGVMWLTTDPANPALGFFRSMGFTARPSDAQAMGWPVHRDFKGPGKHRVVFEKVPDCMGALSAAERARGFKA